MQDLGSPPDEIMGDMPEGLVSVPPFLFAHDTGFLTSVPPAGSGRGRMHGHVDPTKGMYRGNRRRNVPGTREWDILHRLLFG